MNPRSLAKTLTGERLTRAATLQGYRRKANVVFDGYAYMNIVADQGSSVTGILIPLEESELAAFAKREAEYAVVDITASLQEATDARVVAFIAPDVPCTHKIPRSYLLTCTAGMDTRSREEWIRDTEYFEIHEDEDRPVYEFAAK